MGEYRFILLTGPPGVGKTTLIKNIYKQLEAANISCQGFYTEEVRSEAKAGTEIRKRVGFDVVTLQGQRGFLSRKLGNNDESMRFIRFGNYAVFWEEFERIALPQLDLKGASLLVIDEIGKMELTSKKFKTGVAAAINAEVPLLATIPQTRAPFSRMIEDLKKSPKSKIFEITKENRDEIKNEIVKCLESLIKN